MISPIIVTNSLTGISGGQYFTATNQIRILLGAQVSAAVGNVVINAVLIPHYGYMGAAAATVVSSLLCAVVQYCHLLKQMSLPGLVRKSVMYCIFAAGMYAVIWLLSRNMPAAPLTSIVQVFVGVSVYLAACFVVKDETLRYMIDTGSKVLLH